MEQMWDNEISKLCPVCGLSKGTKTTKADCVCNRKKLEPSPEEKALQAKIVKEAQIEHLKLQLERLEKGENPPETPKVEEEIKETKSVVETVQQQIDLRAMKETPIQGQQVKATVVDVTQTTNGLVIELIIKVRN